MTGIAAANTCCRENSQSNRRRLSGSARSWLEGNRRRLLWEYFRGSPSAGFVEKPAVQREAAHYQLPSPESEAGAEAEIEDLAAELGPDSEKIGNFGFAR